MTQFISIFFWTKQQLKLLESLEKQRNTVILGDYGTGKTLILLAVAEKIRKMGLKLVYINALDHVDLYNSYYFKTTEDVLDVIVKSRFGSEVEVLDVGTLRRKYLERNSLKLEIDRETKSEWSGVYI